MGACRDLGLLANLAPNDDTFINVDFGFTVDIGGSIHEIGVLSNNGWLAFVDSATLDYTDPLPDPLPPQTLLLNTATYYLNFTPMDWRLLRPAVAVVAPLFGDVDTRSEYGYSGEVRYGNVVVAGREAWAVDWIDVGVYSNIHTVTNRFQLIVYSVSSGYLIECNVDRVQWEAGQASGGLEDGLFDLSLAVDLTGNERSAPLMAGLQVPASGSKPAFDYYVPGSFTPRALLDGGPLALASHSYRSEVPGRYLYGDFGLASALRLGQRDDGAGPNGHPRLGGTSQVPNHPTSVQANPAPRLGQSNTYT